MELLYHIMPLLYASIMTIKHHPSPGIGLLIIDTHHCSPWTTQVSGRHTHIYLYIYIYLSICLLPEHFYMLSTYNRLTFQALELVRATNRASIRFLFRWRLPRNCRIHRRHGSSSSPFRLGWRGGGKLQIQWELRQVMESSSSDSFFFFF